MNFSFFTFFLDKKSNKKVKANAIAPQALPSQRTGTPIDWSVIAVSKSQV